MIAMQHRAISSKTAYLFPIIIFAAFTAWWLYLRQFELDSTRDGRQLWGATYQILALYGGVVGLFISHKWGGTKSLLGRIIIAFSVGLLLQLLGQTYSSYYVYYYAVESPPYPAIGDIGFFSSVLVYIYAVFLLSKISGVKLALKKWGNKVVAFMIPCIVLFSSYYFFLTGYEAEGYSKVGIL
jgi:hypothetical protein